MDMRHLYTIGSTSDAKKLQAQDKELVVITKHCTYKVPYCMYLLPTMQTRPHRKEEKERSEWGPWRFAHSRISKPFAERVIFLCFTRVSELRSFLRGSSTSPWCTDFALPAWRPLFHSPNDMASIGRCALEARLGDEDGDRPIPSLICMTHTKTAD